MLIHSGSDYKKKDTFQKSCLDYAQEYSWRNGFIEIVEEIEGYLPAPLIPLCKRLLLLRRAPVCALLLRCMSGFGDGWGCVSLPPVSAPCAGAVAAF